MEFRSICNPGKANQIRKQMGIPPQANNRMGMGGGAKQMGKGNKMNNNLKIGEPQCKSIDNNDYIFIKIPLSNTFSEKNKYDVNIIINSTQRNQPY